MELRTVVYRDAYLGACVDLLNDTWNFDRFFPRLTRPGLINELFFRDAIAGANHAELIVDESDRVHGYLFGMLAPTLLDRLRRAARALGTLSRVVFHYLRGTFGPRRHVRRRAAELIAMTTELEMRRRRSDGYVSLFIVGSSLRGLGWGKRLMRKFERRCGELGHDRIYLWTDKGCNYGFYDHAGFRRIHEIRSPLLAHYGEEPNGFVYARPVAAGRVE